MNMSLSITTIVFISLLLIIILYLLRQSRISIKYSIMWIFMILVAFIVLIIPNLLTIISKFLGFELVSNMVLCIFIVILLLISIALTVMITDQKKKITRLIQEVGILKKVTTIGSRKVVVEVSKA